MRELRERDMSYKAVCANFNDRRSPGWMLKTLGVWSRETGRGSIHDMTILRPGGFLGRRFTRLISSTIASVELARTNLRRTLALSSTFTALCGVMYSRYCHSAGRALLTRW
jgi:hypothetical protein